MDDLLLLFIAFFLGACVGSFLNVVIHRVPRGLSVSNPKRSFCPSCKNSIPAYRNIPLLSWIVLRGRCADCKSRIPVRYFAVELATALLFLLIALGELERGGAPNPWRLAIEFTAVALCVAITVIDFQLAIIPDPLTIPWIPLLVTGVAFQPDVLRGRWLDLAVNQDSPHLLALGLAGLALGAFPALFVDFARRERVVDSAGEPTSALPTADEEFSLWLETREFLKPLLLPAFAGAGLSILVLHRVDLAAHPHLAAAIASAAGAGGGMLVIYGIRFVFSAVFGREAMGLGDAKFLALAGTLLGAEGAALVFGAACFLGALPAFGSLLVKLPVPTIALLVATLLPIFGLVPLARATSAPVALAVGVVLPMVALLVFFRRLRRGDVELSAMPFGPFLALASVILLVSYPQVVGFLTQRFT